MESASEAPIRGRVDRVSDIGWPSGVVARNFAGHGDFTAIANIFNTSVHADHSEGMSSAEDFANELTHDHTLDIERGLLIVEAEGVPVGWVVARWFKETDGPMVYRHMAKLVPSHRRQGIGTAMLRWAQSYLAAAAATHEDADRQFQTDVDDSECGAVIILTTDNYQPVQHHADMVRPDLENIPERPLPQGVEMRPVQDEHLRAIWESDIEAFRDHVGYVEQTEDDWLKFLNHPSADATLWTVAWHEDKVVGQVRSVINAEQNAAMGRKRGYTEDISTTREWRGRGIAGALIAAGLHKLKARGMEEAGLGVHVDNPTGAYRLYESMGFGVVASGATYQRPVTSADLDR